jgi:biotin carboxyl carrier protein
VFHCVRAGDAIHLAWRGATYVLEEETEEWRAAHRHVAGGLEAPMPGKVIAVRVAPGQEVAKGDELVVVEAMKMENELRSPKAGRVKDVQVTAGTSVEAGRVLVVIE